MKTIRNHPTLTDEAIVDAMVPPVRLSTRQQQVADSQLAAARKARRLAVTPADERRYQLRKFRLQLEDYIRRDDFEPEKHFGFFLREYLRTVAKKQKEFADDIHIHRTTVASLINNTKKPNDSLIIRLELHSAGTIPAIDWYKLHEMEKGYEIRHSKALREKESNFVKATAEL